MSDVNTPNQAPAWLNSITDPGLRREVQSSASANDFTGMIRTAFVHLESRIRESIGLEEHLYGKDLIDRAFHPKDGILQPTSSVGSERAGLHHLLLGIFFYYRNPIAHRSVYHTPESALQVVSLIDHALRLVKDAVEVSLNLDNIVGPQEGQIWRRRDYRVDINKDGEPEIVILLELGPVVEGGQFVPHLLPLILTKTDTGAYRRIPTEWVQGESVYGPQGVELHHVTSQDVPDVVASWTWGNSQTCMLILRRQDDRYVITEREIPSGLRNPVSGPAEKAFVLHMRQWLHYADVDGDGLEEMVQTLRFDPDDLPRMGYPAHLDDPEQYVLVTRVWKWDVEKQKIVLTEERPIARRDTPPLHIYQ